MELENHCLSTDAVESMCWRADDVCCACFSEDGAWYRARVEENQTGNKVKVCLWLLNHHSGGLPGVVPKLANYRSCTFFLLWECVLVCPAFCLCWHDIMVIEAVCNFTVRCGHGFVFVHCICLCLFSVHSVWLLQVFYVDYGNSETVSSSDLRPLPRSFAKLPSQALQCYLSRVKPVGQIVKGHLSEWPREACECFSRLVAERDVRVMVKQSAMVRRNHLVWLHLLCVTFWSAAVSGDCLSPPSFSNKCLLERIAHVFFHLKVSVFLSLCAKVTSKSSVAVDLLLSFQDTRLPPQSVSNLLVLEKLAGFVGISTPASPPSPPRQPTSPVRSQTVASTSSSSAVCSSGNDRSAYEPQYRPYPVPVKPFIFKVIQVDEQGFIYGHLVVERGRCLGCRGSLPCGTCLLVHFLHVLVTLFHCFLFVQTV